MSKTHVELTDKQITEIKELAAETRRYLGVHPEVPVGNDIRLFLEKKDILLCEYPFSESGDTHTYGNIVIFNSGDERITFIGLNTAGYYDEQIFALAHEIYHFTTETGKAYSKDNNEEKEVEKKADRFAAEFLLPADVLKNIVTLMYGTTSLKDVPEMKIMRFVAGLQCDWWMPYQAIINRLYEEKLISKAQYAELYEIDCRSEEGVYRRILNSTNSEISDLLNTKTRTVGVSRKIIDTIIDNYEDGIIDEDEFIRLLALFDKKPEDYGVEITTELDDDLLGIMGNEETE